jgi:alcohol dehydrogenase, propanol-preferring
MKSLQLTAWQHEAEFTEQDQPDPGPGEVLVRIGGAGACHSDLHLMHDFTDGVLPWGPPFTLGHENAGWVEALGDGVTGLEVGEAVAVYGSWGCGHCARCRRGMENYCERQSELGGMGGGLGFDGGMAPFMLVPRSRWLVPLGDLSPLEAAPLTDAGLTPYHAVVRSLPLLGAGSVATVIGVGGLGHMAVQILRALTGATIIAVDQRDDALSLATKAGADHTVRSGPDATAEVLEMTKGRGADVTLDMVGSDATLALGAASTRVLGHLTIVGLGGGTLPISFFGIPYEVSVATTYWGTLPELMEVVELARAGRIRADVTEYPLDRALDAYRALEEGAIEGRAVIVP